MIKSSLKCTCFSISTEESIQDVRTAGVLFLLFTERSILPTMLKVLSKCIREYKQASLKAPLMVSLEVVMECIIPFIIAQLVNRMKAGAGFSEIAMYGLVLVVMATLSLIFGITAGNACATASCGFAKNVRKDLFYKIQDFSFENIDRFSSSSLVTRLTTDVTNVQMAYMMIVRIAIRAPLMLVFAFVMAFIMGGRMACIFIIVVPILGIGLFSIIRLVMPLFRAVFNKYDALNNSVQENISEHSLEVAMLAHGLSLIANEKCGKHVDSNEIALMGMYHDANEIITGDMPTPVKYYDDDIKEAYKRVEYVASKKMVDKLPDYMKKHYEKLFFPQEDKAYEWRLVKAADKLSALIKCKQELNSGNQEFKTAYETTKKALHDMNMEEVEVFMQDFLPAYDLTLDELQAK